MAHTLRRLRAVRKNIAIFTLALLAGTPALASSYNFRVAARGLKPSVVAPPGSTIPQLNFSSCGQVGRAGPTLDQCQTAYAAQSSLLTSLAMPGYQGYQEWTVPATGSYTITAAGAGGGTTPQSIAVGGRGAILSGTFNLTAGTVLQVVVGQAGIDAQPLAANSITDGGGGGGTFVVKKATNTPLIIAGGGGGANYYSNGARYGSGGDGAMAPTAANPSTVGTLSSTLGVGEPGASFSADGALPSWSNGNQFTVALGFWDGAVGGISTNAPINRFGGFGGGGGSHGNSCIGAGAGGGYVGGIGAASCGGGGGGSSYFDGSAGGRASSTGTYGGTTLGTSALGYNPVSTAGYVTIKQN